MERLTRKNWRNLDPWETCGQDNYCKRGCHEQGGCTKGCIVPRIYARLAAYEDTGLEPEEIKNALDVNDIIPEINVTVDHIRDLLQAEQDGRLVMFPCKVGDTVYVIRTMTHSEALKSGVPEFRDKWSNRKYARKRAQYRPMIVEERKMVKTYFSQIGKTVFLTREEAEAALKGGEG